MTHCLFNDLAGLAALYVGWNRLSLEGQNLCGVSLADTGVVESLDIGGTPRLAILLRGYVYWCNPRSWVVQQRSLNYP